MPNKSIAWKLLLLVTILGALMLGDSLRRQPVSAAGVTPAWGSPARCSINADCGRAICVADVCISAARECLTDAGCGRHGVCTHDGMCYRLR